MRALKTLAYVLILSIIPSLTKAQQDIPIGTFRLHVSYNNIQDITFDGVNKTFAASSHGIQVLDRSNGESSGMSKANGISGGTISNVAFDAATRKLIITYVEGYFDVLDESNVSLQFDPSSNSTLSGPRAINDVAIADKVAYLATDYGVVVFNLGNNRVRETWRDLGISGQDLAIRHIALKTDSIFLATPQGILAGKISDNLHDFSKWKRYQYWPFSSPVSGLAVWHDAAYAAVNGIGLFKLDNGVWKAVDGIPADQYFSLDGSQDLVLSATSGIYRFDESEHIGRLSSPLFPSPRFASVDKLGNLWIGDGQTGLVSAINGTYASLLPQCPANDVATRLYYSNGKLLAVGGAYNDNRSPLHRRGVVDVFHKGLWTTVSLPASDLLDVTWEESTQTINTASYGYGVTSKSSSGEPQIFNDLNSTLVKATSPVEGVLVTSLAKSKNGLLALNYGVTPSLHLMSLAGQWTSYNIPVSRARYGQRIVVDDNDNSWMIIDPQQGGGIVVFNHHDGSARLLSDAPGEGALPSMTIYSLRLDRNGAMWIGTSAGVAYIPNAKATLQSPADAIKPIVDGRFALRDDAVTAIAVDGGNRKWFGTRRGIWLYSASAEQALGSFTASKTALPSDNILDIDINQLTGEVFIATDQGLASYRAAASEPLTTSGPVKIFPNPVPATFVGSIGITGTPANAIIKITDVSGKLVWETKANGSTASWNLYDDRGRHAPTGVYIVFAVSDDGDQREVGKLVVIN
ncbi:two-component regulator propeller domain-containing protein [Chryseolinea sp. T2]|uniref:type IX secretion system anionic LPS delivery protein PorZ n=1 Tax=Chryseolinea sp. T2 TaxID=3129255 RepID=UPI0030785040